MIKLIKSWFTLPKVIKPVQFAKLSLAFVDSKGAKYYQYDDFDDMPVARRLELEEFLQLLNAKISSNEIDKFIETMKATLEADKKDCKQTMTWLVKEMELRKKELVHPNLMFDVSAIQYIRHDEKPEVFDYEIHQQKVESFKREAGGSLHAFFHQRGFKDYLNGLPLSAKELDTYLKSRIEKLKLQDEILTSIITEYQSSTKEAMSGKAS